MQIIECIRYDAPNVSANVMFKMNKIYKSIFVGVTAIAILAMTALAILDSGWVVVPKWYNKTKRSKTRRMQTTLLTISRLFKETGVEPPKDEPIIHAEDSEHWGFPIQYSYEDNIPTLRAAGADGKLNTRDDILQKVKTNVEQRKL